MPPKRKRAVASVAKGKDEAPPAKTTKGKKENKSKKTQTVSPDQGKTGETAAFKWWEEIESQSQFLKQNKEMLELFQNQWGQGYDELLKAIEWYIRTIETIALYHDFLTGPDKEKDKVTEKDPFIIFY